MRTSRRGNDGVATGNIETGGEAIDVVAADGVASNGAATAMIAIDPNEVEWSAIRAQGAGGQNVNKVSTALHLRYDIRASSLPQDVKDRLLRSGDQRISGEGVLIIKAQRYRSQERNREDALARVQALVDAAAVEPVERRPTRPTRGSQRRRIESKVRRGQVKAGRQKISLE